LDAKELRDLIELISKSDFMTFELEREGFKLRLEKRGAGPGAAGGYGPMSPPVSAVSAPAPSHLVAAPAPAPLPAAAPAGAPAPATAAADATLVELMSPIVGTFFRQPSPTSAPFVEPGSKVKKGQVLCIIEAMKLMNEIEAEMDAEVVDILVANGQPVEFGEALFRLRPMAS
jgi:acetyl-CoA carboxylase biotin carboxyl carrier protein